MSSSWRQLHLNVFVSPNGHHDGAWRHEGSTNPDQAYTLGHYAHVARVAERGKLDSLFFADGVALWGDVKYNIHNALEPLTLLPALAAVTERIGLIATASTTYNEPYHLARKFASLDHISGGRAGWNIVTSAGKDEARNFGLPARPDHEWRYQRAGEFVAVVKKLWDSWDDGALITDRESGAFTDTSKIFPVNHEGQHFTVAGPLNLPRPVQGHPLLVQAGSSGTGRDFAALHAEAVFTAQQTFAEGRAFYDDLKARAAGHGRRPEHIAILPGLVPIVGRTEGQARQIEAELNALIEMDYGVRQLSKQLNFDLSGYPLDAPLPEINGMHDGNQSRHELIADLARREQLTIRQLVERLACGRGHHVSIGTAAQVADEMEHWFSEGAADGFNLMPATIPGGLQDFVDQVVPELQRRGLFRSEYTGTTLRDHYGLARPGSLSRSAGRLRS